MKRSLKKTKIGILGCGAIGSRMAKSIVTNLKKDCALSALYDIDASKSQHVAQCLGLSKGIIKRSYPELLKSCNFVVEAISSKNTKNIIAQAIRAKKDVMVMSVGKILNAPSLFLNAIKNKCVILIPSGGIGGLDAVKAATVVGISSIAITTRKPIKGFAQSPYLDKKKIRLDQIIKETIIFDGNVADAVKWFPRNINVAATLALAAKAHKKLKVRILTSPQFTVNSHEISATGSFGRIHCKIENLPCPDNPKTSYLAVLSGIQTLGQYFKSIKIGT